MNSALKYEQSFGKCDEQDMIICSTLFQRAALFDATAAVRSK